MTHLEALTNKIESLEKELERLKSIRDRLGNVLEQNDLIEFILDLSLDAAPLNTPNFSPNRDGPAEDKIERLFVNNDNEPCTVRQIQTALSMTEYQVRNTIYANPKFEKCGAKKFRLSHRASSEITGPAAALPTDDFPGIPRSISVNE